MIRIRLARRGAKNNPFYRVVAIEKDRKITGKPLEVLGYWYPKKNEKRLDKKAIEKWVGKGAKLTKAVRNLID